MNTGAVAYLNTGATIPLIGLGTGGGLSQKKDEIKAVVATALQVGYRHFDTASVYGSEDGMREALNDAYQSGIVKRDEIFITSKLWNDDHDDPVSALKTTLEKLQMEYLDLFLIHWPVKFRKGANQPLQTKEEDFLPLDLKSTWRGMERCVELGITKAIGLSNFSCKKIEDLLSYAKIPPAVNQVEMHPVWQQKKLRDYCSKMNIHVCAWSPLGAPGSPFGSNAVMHNPVIHDIAKIHGKTPAQVLLRWGLEQGVSMIPKSYNKGRITENFQIFDWCLTAEDHEKISKMDQRKLNLGNFVINSTTSPYKTVQELWDEAI
eukprot:Gb_31078 [translate_table: standard]